jgi:hypothetical protein
MVQADRLVGGSDAVLVIDDTAIAAPIQSVSLRKCFWRVGQNRQLPKYQSC